MAALPTMFERHIEIQQHGQIRHQSTHLLSPRFYLCDCKTPAAPLRWIHKQPEQAADFFTTEMGVKQPYARRGIDYFTKNKIFPIDGSVTLSGLRVNIEVQFRDGVLKKPLPEPEKYVDQSFIRPAQKELRL